MKPYAKLFCCILISLSAVFVGCSSKAPDKAVILSEYNSSSLAGRPTLGEGDYPLNADFKGIDAGKEPLASALVESGFLKVVDRKTSGRTVTYELTETGRKNYDERYRGFVWGRHEAVEVIKVSPPANVGGEEIFFALIRTRIVDIPEWAKKPVIYVNYPVVKSALLKNEYYFAAKFKRSGKNWKLEEVRNSDRPG